MRNLAHDSPSDARWACMPLQWPHSITKAMALNTTLVASVHRMRNRSIAQVMHNGLAFHFRGLMHGQVHAMYNCNH